MKKILLYVLPTLLIPVLSFSQVTKERDVIASGGEESVTPNLQVAWTVGEVAINYSENPNLIVSEGFEQAEISDVGIIEDEFNGVITVYPNPVSDQLFYDIQSEEEVELTGALIGESGRVVMEIPSFKVSGEHTGHIEMSDLPSGKWILRFYSTEDSLTHSFSIIKVN